MKKIIGGGFLTLSGNLGLCTCYLLADRSLTDQWSFSRYLATIFQQGYLGFEFLLYLVMALTGVVLLYLGFLEK